MKVGIVRSSHPQLPRIVKINYSNETLIQQLQEVMVEDGHGVGSFFRVIDGKSVYVPDDEPLSPNIKDNDNKLYYHIMEYREPMIDDVYAAIILNDAPTLSRLIKQFDVNYQSIKYGTPLMYALNKQVNNPTILQRIVERGATDVNTQLNNYYVDDPLTRIRKETSCYPIHVVTRLNDLLTVELFVQHGANVNLTDYEGKTPLMLTNSIPIMTYLLENGADINVVDSSGYNILHHKIDSASPEVIRFLLRNGVDFNARDRIGNTPLIMLVNGRKLDMDKVELLLLYGADRNITNRYNLTAEAIARRKGNNELADMIRDYGTELIKQAEL